MPKRKNRGIFPSKKELTSVMENILDVLNRAGRNGLDSNNLVDLVNGRNNLGAYLICMDKLHSKGYIIRFRNKSNVKYFLTTKFYKDNEVAFGIMD